MALITCSECGQQISDRAKACPHCGFDMSAPKYPDCGTYLPAGVAACPQCGCPVEEAAPAAAPAPTAPVTGGTSATSLMFPSPRVTWNGQIPPHGHHG